jgi:hypothetical protein
MIIVHISKVILYKVIFDNYLENVQNFILEKTRMNIFGKSSVLASKKILSIYKKKQVINYDIRTNLLIKSNRKIDI